MNISLNSMVMAALVHLHGEHAVERPALLVEVNQVGGRMPVDPVTVTVALDQDAVFMPLIRSEFLDLEPTDNPTVPLGSTTTFSPVGENPAAFFLIEHPVVLGFSGHDAALVSCQASRPNSEDGYCGTDPAVATGGYATLTLRSKLRTVAAFQVMK